MIRKVKVHSYKSNRINNVYIKVCTLILFIGFMTFLFNTACNVRRVKKRNLNHNFIYINFQLHLMFNRYFIYKTSVPLICSNRTLIFCWRCNIDDKFFKISWRNFFVNLKWLTTYITLKGLNSAFPSENGYNETCKKSL